MSDEQRSWITNEGDKPRRQGNDWAATVGILGTLIIICTTIVLLVKL